MEHVMEKLDKAKKKKNTLIRKSKVEFLNRATSKRDEQINKGSRHNMLILWEFFKACKRDNSHAYKFLKGRHKKLHKTVQQKILKSASKVCTTWKKICKDPAMWKVIDMRKQVYRWSMNFHIETLITKLVDLSCGELIDFSVEGGFEIIPILDYAVQRSSKMKRLYIQNYDYDLVSGGFIWAIKKLPQLEEFHLSCTYPSAML
ncbi:unnamed protein product [Lactuca saligna]|uniref:F-box domain-containing protein n=1 Tax=Lactuca saligna TaxID=75948 RepID=A0AA36EDZ5_LACSI|nr:unnamed protein product [Lactuca saligna]